MNLSSRRAWLLAAASAALIAAFLEENAIV